MLNTVEVRTPQGALLQLPLFDISEGFAVEDINGLGPVKANLVTSSQATMDGVQYHSARREARNLIFTIGLEPDWEVGDVEALRDKLYKFFMTKRRVDLRFIKDNGLQVDISGRVEDADPDIFSAEPKVTISVLCPQPDFFDATPVVVNGVTTAAQTETLIDYAGNADTGVVFTMTVDRSVPEFTIYHRGEDAVISSMPFSSPLVAGDTIEISTVPGNKYATLTNGSGESSILYGISPASKWLALDQGENYIRVYAEGAAIPWTIEYTTKYGGL